MKKNRFLVFVLILCLLVFDLPFGTSNVKAADIYDCSFPVIYGQTDARAMLSLINNLRTSASDAIYKNMLTYDYGLEKAAMQRAAELAILVDDYRPDGNKYTQTLADFGFDIGDRGPIYGENVVYGTLDSMDMEAAFKFWCEDPGCRTNLLSGFSYVGIGHIKVEKNDYWSIIFSTHPNDSNLKPANDSETIVTVKVRSSIVGNIKIEYESGSLSVPEGDYVAAPRYVPSVEFINRDPDEELVLAPLDFNSNDGIVSAYSGIIVGLKEGSGTISANLFGRTFSYGITVTHGNGTNVNIPTQVITQAPTQAPTESPTPTQELIGIVLLPTQGGEDNPTLNPTQAPTQAPTQVVTKTPDPSIILIPTQQVTETPTQVVTESPTKTPTKAPTEVPTKTPTKTPTETPTQTPTQAVTDTPVQQVTQTPTDSPVQTVTPTTTPAQTVTPTTTPAVTSTPDNGKTSLKKGDTFIVDGLEYKVLSKNTVEVEGYSGKSNATKLTIPATVKKNGTKYSVTKIAANAFNGNKKLTAVVIGKNVTTIGKKAFYGCKKVKTVTINGTKLKKVGSKAFGSIYSKAVIKVPKSVKSKYDTLLSKSGLGSKVKIQNK